jgi:hypothetical protein
VKRLIESSHIFMRGISPLQTYYFFTIIPYFDSIEERHDSEDSERAQSSLAAYVLSFLRPFGSKRQSRAGAKKEAKKHPPNPSP